MDGNAHRTRPSAYPPCRPLFAPMPERIFPERLDRLQETDTPGLCDRFVDSTTAYQGYARKLDFGFIQNLHAFSLCGRWPDLTFVLDIDVDTSYQRMHKRYANSAPVNDRIEAESRAFHTAVREGFLDIAKKNPGRVKVIDANRLPEIIAADLWWEVYHAIV